ncbi:BMP family ABC transporter substrate-binding protein [Microbacterium sp. SORGH_AS_0888]|uniref:BMP family ABC transporter substrate-binding protein n=1 Tax=Microbacterium sp. SORGH_AS_0888 TaxID=3041791 RepID=UPI00277F91A0|nr:BMP family ABC transporter substrate-binding protein [Microbacterium sp. SORGH_AS_0888]MDQ1130317.1 basic membrane protein A [Microbacterium sp. SORGH_AS_0888]
MRSSLFTRAQRGVALLLVTVAALALAACSSGGADPGATGSGGSVIFVHDQQAGDGSVTDSTIAGVKAFATQQGWTSSDVYVADSANYESTLRNAADAGPKMIVTEFYRITDATNAVAKEYPDIKFLHLYADEVKPPISNLLTVGYDTYKLMYVSGILAATFSSTGKVGMVMGDTQPLIAADYNAFKAGAQAAAPGIQVSYGVVGNYDDAAKAQEVAEQLYGTGVDVIQTDAGGADAGTIAAAQAAPGRYIVASSLSALTDAAAVTLAVSGLEFSDSVLETAPMLLASDFSGGHYATGVGDALKLTYPKSAPNTGISAAYDKALAAVNAALPDIKSGATEVPFVNTVG